MPIQIKLPHEEFPGLFEDVQLSGIFADSKTFVDSIPKSDPELIIKAYREQKDKESFSMDDFIHAYFQVPGDAGSLNESDTTMSTSEHIKKLWPHLKREGSNAGRTGTLIPLTHPYVVPGGRFREIYYWDSYFTMLGLSLSDEVGLIESMVQNFADQIDSIGHIPNGNRTYFVSRSQPPFFSLMVKLLASHQGSRILDRYLLQLRKEYDFWMDGPRKVTMDDGHVLNRYSDDLAVPRPESFAEDFELTEDMPEAKKRQVLRDIRAACESGWDFSSRWLADPDDLSTIRTTELIPVDLNSLLLYTEQLLCTIYERKGDADSHAYFINAVERRISAIDTYLWNNESGMYCDYHYPDKSKSGILSMAAFFPLYFNIASASQAKEVIDQTTKCLLQPGGWMTTDILSGQQWDAPNGWAPLQWIAFRALANYGYADLAADGARRWLDLNDRVFKSTGKMMEKYNVSDLTLTAGGGEYPVQDGFGWTNGVYLALAHELKKIT